MTTINRDYSPDHETYMWQARRQAEFRQFYQELELAKIDEYEKAVRKQNIHNKLTECIKIVSKN